METPAEIRLNITLIIYIFTVYSIEKHFFFISLQSFAANRLKIAPKPLILPKYF